MAIKKSEGAKMAIEKSEGDVTLNEDFFPLNIRQKKLNWFSSNVHITLNHFENQIKSCVNFYEISIKFALFLIF